MIAKYAQCISKNEKLLRERGYVDVDISRNTISTNLIKFAAEE
jgi:hypothetical protein